MRFPGFCHGGAASIDHGLVPHRGARRFPWKTFSSFSPKSGCTSVGEASGPALTTSKSRTCFTTPLATSRRSMNADFAAFMQRFGEVGSALVEAGEAEAVLGLQRLYWYFVEFGFVRGGWRPRTAGGWHHEQLWRDEPCVVFEGRASTLCPRGSHGIRLSARTSFKPNISWWKTWWN